jgi:hypothetical protein
MSQDTVHFVRKGFGGFTGKSACGLRRAPVKYRPLIWNTWRKGSPDIEKVTCSNCLRFRASHAAKEFRH